MKMVISRFMVNSGLVIINNGLTCSFRVCLQKKTGRVPLGFFLLSFWGWMIVCYSSFNLAIAFSARLKAFSAVTFPEAPTR